MISKIRHSRIAMNRLNNLGCDMVEPGLLSFCVAMLFGLGGFVLGCIIVEIIRIPRGSWLAAIIVIMVSIGAELIGLVGLFGL